MQTLVATAVVLLTSCAITTDWIYNGIMNRPPSKWSNDECRMVIGRAMANNAKDNDASIRVFALPFTPLIITALNQEQRNKKQLSDDDYQMSIQQEAKECLGMHVDWQTNSYLDAKGGLYKSAMQMDSLMFLVTFDTKARENPYINVVFPGGPTTSHEGVLGNPLNWTADTPADMGDLAQKIFLQNDKGERIKPRYVWMRKRGLLVKSESMLAMFDLQRGTTHFLQGAQEMDLVVNGFGKVVRLPFDLSSGQFEAQSVR
ncbi:MAG: hypothetical protein ABSF91_10700 [Bacteroidota bacterium]|jgi:hypothetical protein